MNTTNNNKQQQQSYEFLKKKAFDVPDQLGVWMFRIFRSANSAQDAESERLEVHVGSAAGAPKFPAPARAAVAASMTHRKQSVPLPLSPIRARCL